MRRFLRDALKGGMLMTVIRVSLFGSVHFARDFGASQGCKNPSSNNMELSEMAKGENLEKPKKGGMVIVIGVGKPTKPKKSDLKKSGPRRRGGGAASNRSRKVQMKERMEEDPNYLQTQYERFNVDEDFMNKYFEHHHGKSLDEAIDDDGINIIESMKQARKSRKRRTRPQQCRVATLAGKPRN